MHTTPVIALPDARLLAIVCAIVVLAGAGAVFADDGGEGTHLHVGRGRVPTIGAAVTAAADGETIHVGRVRADSPAARAGLRAGDRIVSVNGCRIHGAAGWDAALARALPGATLSLGIWRTPGTAPHGALVYLSVPTGAGVPAAGASVPPVPVPDAPCEP